MKKVLFVDDELDILEGWQDSLRKHRRRWDMTFVCGGQAAIKEISHTDYDVVVCDIRMPGVDGVEVLQYAKDKDPKTMRIALTGYADEKSTLKLTTLAQRYLTKPCTVQELDEAISRDSGLIEAFDNPVVRQLAGSAGRLPSADNARQLLLAKLNTTKATKDDIVKIIEEDLALTAKILQLANSSFFRQQTSVVSAKDAVSYLGVEVIRSLVLADQLFESSTDLEKMKLFDFGSIRRHSLMTSTIAKRIAPTKKLAAVGMTAGLLHDVGKIIISLEQPDRVASLYSLNEGGPLDWVGSDAERDILGCTHAEVGGYFLNLWGIPTEVVEAVTFHDNPSAVYTSELDAAGLVHISNYLAHWVDSPAGTEVLEEKLDREYIHAVGIASNEQAWKEIALDIASELDGSLLLKAV